MLLLSSQAAFDCSAITESGWIPCLGDCRGVGPSALDVPGYAIGKDRVTGRESPCTLICVLLSRAVEPAAACIGVGGHL